MLVSEQELTPALSLFNITFMLSQALGYILLAPIALSVLPTFELIGITIDPFVYSGYKNVFIMRPVENLYDSF